jgi:hypothetical protein
MNTKDVTLIFIDEEQNHQNASRQIGMRMYRKVVNFNDFDRLKDFIESLSNKDDYFLLFIHVFRDEKCKGYYYGIKGEIEQAYPKLKIHWVTSDQAGNVSDIIHEPQNVYTYYDIKYRIEDDTLKPIKLFNNGEAETEESNMQNYIFISHSSQDKKIVKSFIENILTLGLGIPNDNEHIFCTSYPATAVSTGEDIPDTLREALDKMTLFIQYISEDYKKSEVCLNEMGAAWSKLPKSKIIAIKAPNISFSELGFLNIQRIGLCINKEDDLFKLLDDYKDIFKDYNLTNYKNKVKDFLTENGF